MNEAEFRRALIPLSNWLMQTLYTISHLHECSDSIQKVMLSKLLWLVDQFGLRISQKSERELSTKPKSETNWAGRLVRKTTTNGLVALARSDEPARRLLGGSHANPKQVCWLVDQFGPTISKRLEGELSTKTNSEANWAGRSVRKIASLAWRRARVQISPSPPFSF